MFCSNCGTENSGDAKFCQSCGHALAGSVVSTPRQPTTANVMYAGFWLRFAAHLIDGIVLAIPGVAIAGLFVVKIIAMLGDFEDIDLSDIWPIINLMIVLGTVLSVLKWLYFALMESSSRQATLGKLLLGIKVTDLSGHRISFLRASGRFFGKILSGMILSIGFIMAGFTEKKQALHDMLAGTLVVRTY